MQSSMSVFNMAFLQVNRKDTIRQRKVSEKEKSQCVWKLLLTTLIKIELTVIRAAHTSGQMSFVPFPSRPLSQRHVASQTQASTCNVIHKYTLFPQTNYKQYTHFFHTHKYIFLNCPKTTGSGEHLLHSCMSTSGMAGNSAAVSVTCNECFPSTSEDELSYKPPPPLTSPTPPEFMESGCKWFSLTMSSS